MEPQDAVGGEQAVVYCVIPRDLDRLHEPLRRHFLRDPQVDVIIEQRARDRRRTAERRATPPAGRDDDRRTIRNAAGRRIDDRRAPQVSVDAPPLPRRARMHASRLVFVERLAPTSQEAEDVDTARIVTRFQAGADDAFGELYLRYFSRVYTYLKIAFDEPADAEDATQQVFVKVLEALARYERRSNRPFRAWLFTVVRNHALTELRSRARVDPIDPERMRERQEAPADADLDALKWVSDPELVMLIERLPLAQRQVLLLRFMLDLSSSEIGAILGRSPDDVRGLQSRALRFLRARLTALGRAPERHSDRIRMRRVARNAPVLRLRRFALH